MAEWESDEVEETGKPGKWGRAITTAVTLLILVSFLGVILVTFYNQFTGRQTLPPRLPPIAFLREDANGVWQLFLTNAPTGEKVTPLTFETEDVLHFAVSPTHTAVAYTIKNSDDSSTIKLFDWNGRAADNHREMLTCTEAICGPLVWHPDGRRLIYERREGNTPRLWWLDTQTGESVTVLADETAVSQNVAISADGQWLSYADPLNEEMALYAFGAGTQQRLTNVLGSTAVWHPTLPQFLFSDVDLVVYHGDQNQTSHEEHSHDFAEAIHLYLGNTDQVWYPLLSQMGQVDDANPAWSPDGNWIAFGRKPAQTNAGRQLWLMRADGTEARPLTESLTIHHGPPVWSPDGRYLLFQRFDTADPAAAPGIALIEVSTGNVTRLLENGILPAWIP
jgi:TolB protein